MEAAHKTALAKGEVGIRERKMSPMLKDFADRFLDEIRVTCAERPSTAVFYSSKLRRILEFEPLANARLEAVDESMIAAFVQNRLRQTSRAGANRKKGTEPKTTKPLSPASVNRELATLRRLLRMAHDWRVIERVPRIRLLRGERNREFVLSHAKERLYLAMAPPPLREAATLMLDTGLRVGELLALEWPDVHLQPTGEAKFGFIHVRKGKSSNATRNVSLTARARATLLALYETRRSAHVLTRESGLHLVSIFTIESQHKRLREALKLPPDAVIHSFRHTFGTRLGEAGTDAFTIRQVMGHSSVTVSQKYVHPTPEAMERAFERLEALNQKARAELAGTERLPATISATVNGPASTLATQRV
jgi:integrase